jgi:bifunctional non-homologous end joining protein LigD
LPQELSPQLATLSAEVPARGDWLYEIKFDGYRLLTRLENGKPALITRRGNDWSSKMPGLIRALATFGIDSAWLDGEIVVLGEHGAPDFNALQNAFDVNNAGGIVYFLFDLPFFEGYDLRNAPLRKRRQLLEVILADKAMEHVRFSEAFEGDPAPS